MKQQQSFDAVVIGAGNGGISAACMLAKNGIRTLLVEKHNLPGGAATSFKRGRFEFEVALHEMAEIGPKDDPGETRQLLENVYGLDINFLKVPDLYRLICKEKGYNIDVTMPIGEKPYLEKMVEYFPDCRERMENLFDVFHEFEAAMAFQGQNGFLPPDQLYKQFPNFVRMSEYPANKVLDAMGFSIEEQAVLATYWPYMGVDLENITFIQVYMMLWSFVKKGAYIPELKSHGMSESLIECFQKMGGTVWFNTKAEKVNFADGKPCAVVTDRGEVPCRAVIFNCSPHMAYAHMIPKELVREYDIKLANARTFSAMLFVVYLGLDATAEELGLNDYSYFVNTDANTKKSYDSMASLEGNLDFSALCYNVVNKKASPEGTCIVSLTKQYTSDCWGDIDIRDYYKVKDRIAEESIEYFEKLVGVDLRSHIEEIEVATPWTFARYMGTPQGACYAYETRMWDSILARYAMLGQDHGIPGVSFCGASGPNGDGYNAAMGSGALSGGMIAQYLREGGKQ